MRNDLSDREHRNLHTITICFDECNILKIFGLVCGNTSFDKLFQVSYFPEKEL